MAAALQCPDRATILRVFGQGEPLEEVERLAAHLEQCPHCGESFDDLLRKDADTLALTWSSTSVSPLGDSEPLTKLREKLRRLCAVAGVDTGTAGIGPSDPTNPGPPTDNSMSQTEIGITFLAPPQTSDEIGRLGSYRVLKKLGAGGMGMVFLAEDSQLNRKVALKTMLPTIARNKQARDRFQREARAAAALEHPNVITILHVGEDNGVPYLAMPLLKGESLDERLKREGKLNAGEAMRIAFEMADGLAAAHGQGLIHRDIKPANVWLEAQTVRGRSSSAANDGGGPARVKLLDFGLARTTGDDTHLTQSGAIVGTPAFMAPEQGRGQTVDARADLFSLGCVLYLMLTGQQPFRGETMMGLLASLALDTPKAPHEANPEVPRALSDFVMRLLEKKPEDRPASALDVLDELRPLVRIEAEAKTVVQPVSASPVARPVGASASPKPPRRRVGRLVGFGVLLVGVVAAVSVLTLKTSKGELVIEADDDDIEVTIKQAGKEPRLLVVNKNSKKTLELAVLDGEIEARELPDGLRFKTSRLEMKKGDAVVFSARMLLAAKKAPDRPVDPGTKVEPKTQDREKPFVLVRNGVEVGEFKTMAGVVSSIQNGDTIAVHGNGPFEMGKLEVQGRSLTLKAGAGYRPRFVPHASAYEVDVYWIAAVDGELTLEGCDFLGRPPSNLPFDELSLLRGRNAALTVRNCRVLGLGCLAQVHGKSLRVEDCLILVTQLPGLWGKVDCLFENNVVYIPRSFDLEEAGGQRVTLRNNTFCTWSGYRTPLFRAMAEVRDVVIVTEGNLFDFAPSYAKSSAPLHEADARGRVVWQGRNNLYRSLSIWNENGTVENKGLAAWSRVIERPEEGSREVGPDLHYDLERTHGGRTKDWFAVVQKASEDARRHSGLDVGPDFSLIGPGEAYLKALAAAGKPVAREQLRPEPEPGGPCVVLRDGKALNGYAKLNQAVAAARDGDIVEVRSDAVFEGFVAPSGRGTLTVRAAFGYRPILDNTAVNVQDGTALSLAGFHLRDSGLSAIPIQDVPPERQPRFARLVNCSFEWSKALSPYHGVFQGAGNQPGEIVNCWMPFPLEVLSFGPAQLTVRNSVLGRIKLLPQDRGPAQMDLERCTVWNLDYGWNEVPITAGGLQQGDQIVSTDLRLTARQTLFESNRGLVLPINHGFRWKGERNLFRINSAWTTDVSCLGLETWRSRKDVKEIGSAEADPLCYDPQRWRVLGKDVEGKQVGADVDRVARTAR